MADRPSIESLQDAVEALWVNPSGWNRDEADVLLVALDELESLRAENARLVAERDGLKEKCADLDAGWKTASELLEIQKTHLTAAESRADALAARVEALAGLAADVRCGCLPIESHPYFVQCRRCAVLNSTCVADKGNGGESC